MADLSTLERPAALGPPDPATARTGSTRPGLPLWSDHARFVRRHRRSLVALVTCGLLAGLGVGLLQPSTYTAEASVALTPVPVYLAVTTEELEPPEVSIDTDAQLLGSPEVLGAVAAELGIDADAAADRLSVTATPLSRVLHVAVRATSPDRAATAADAAAEALVERRRETLGSLQASQLVQLRLALSTAELELARAQSRRVVVPETDELFDQVLTARSSLDEVEDALAVPAEVISPASPPVRTDDRNLEVPAVSGAMLGLLLALLLGLARERRRRSPVPATNQPITRSGTTPDTAPRRLDDRHDQ